MGTNPIIQEAVSHITYTTRHLLTLQHFTATKIDVEQVANLEQFTWCHLHLTYNTLRVAGYPFNPVVFHVIIFLLVVYELVVALQVRPEHVMC